MIGQTIGRYCILKKIGSGGGGEVFLARDTSLGRQVALKFLSEAREADSRARKRFLAEARAAAAIDHPYLCKIYEAGEPEGKLLIAMEYVQGQTLKEALASGTLPVKKRLQITLEVTEALAAAHARGIVHRDLKPSNIMLTPDGHVKVMDFGLAKWLSTAAPEHDEDRTVTRTGFVVGTPAYMSPEQAEGRPVDARSDVFSLGIILYEMFAGVHPFQRAARLQTMMAITSTPPDPITRHWPDCPEPLQRIVEGMLVKPAGKRYQSVIDVRADLTGVIDGLEAVTTVPPRPRVGAIGVLPFVNMSRAEEHEYFSDGITEEIILQLSRIRGLRVISRTSAMHYKGTDLDLRTIAEQLGVDTIVEGSVRWAGNRVRISSQLVDVGSNTQIWADAFNREVEDVFGIQLEVAEQIATALERSLTGDDRTPRTADVPQSFEAYQSYLKGRYFLHKLSPEDMKKAIGYFQRALDADPTYARAYAGLSTCYAQAGYLSYVPISETFPRARAAAVRALELDDRLAEAHASMALIRLFLDWDMDGADQEFRRAIELNPNYAEARWLYSWHAAARGRLDEAVAEARRAVELDPLSFMASLNLGWVLMYAKRYDDAVDELHKTLELAPGSVPARFYLAGVYLMQERFDEAIPLFEMCCPTRAQLAEVYVLAGQPDKAREILRQIAEADEQDYDSPFEVALVHFQLDELDQGFELLERAYRERDAKILYMENAPWLERFRSHPRFVEFYRRIGPRS